MIDKVTQEPLTVMTAGDAHPYIWVSLDQLDDVLHLLEAHGVPHWADSMAISRNNSPYAIVINLGYKADVEEVQALLDHARSVVSDVSDAAINKLGP